MTTFDNRVIDDPGGTVGDLLRSYARTKIPDPELLVYRHVRERSGYTGVDADPAEWRIDFPEDPGIALTLPLAFSERPWLEFYPDGREGPAIPVRRGWPTYPGAIPQIGVATGATSEDGQHQTSQGEFAGDIGIVDQATGAILGWAAFYTEPLYTPIVVELIHENRDERDRLHLQLRRMLTPLRRVLPMADSQIRKVTVDDEKSEFHGGPPEQDKPFVVYASVFTVHVYYELLEAVDVVGGAHVITDLTVTVQPV